VAEFCLRYLYPFIILESLDYQGPNKRPMVLGIGLIAKNLGLFAAGLLDALFYTWATKIPVIIYVALASYCCYCSFFLSQEKKESNNSELEEEILEKNE
jgi:hypothetical protein